MREFWLAAGVIPAATVAIGVVYLTQYRVGTAFRHLLVGAHFLAVTAIIVVYCLLCLHYYRVTMWRYAGWALFVLGSVVFWAAVFCHSTCLVPDERRGLVSHLLYRYIRHPIYSGGLLGALGLIGVAPAWQVALAWCLLAACLVSLACIEERELLLRLGAKYREYCRSTKRLVPGVF